MPTCAQEHSKELICFFLLYTYVNFFFGITRNYQTHTSSGLCALSSLIISNSSGKMISGSWWSSTWNFSSSWLKVSFFSLGVPFGDPLAMLCCTGRAVKKKQKEKKPAQQLPSDPTHPTPTHINQHTLPLLGLVVALREEGSDSQALNKRAVYNPK